VPLKIGWGSTEGVRGDLVQFRIRGPSQALWDDDRPTALGAHLDIERQCLEVHFDASVFLLYARAYKVAEVAQMLSHHGLEQEYVGTYPTIASALPNDILSIELFDGYTAEPYLTGRCREPLVRREEKTDAMQSLRQIDEVLAREGLHYGTYILASGRKPG